MDFQKPEEGPKTWRGKKKGFLLVAMLHQPQSWEIRGISVPIKSTVVQSTSEHVKKNPSEKLKKKPEPKFECLRCHEKLVFKTYDRHIKPCKLYHELIEKIVDNSSVNFAHSKLRMIGQDF